MKILFCTNKFEEVSNGPAKFANLILNINGLYPEHEVRILTEDISRPHPYVYRLDLKYPGALRLFSHYFRIQQYHKAAAELRETEYPFDVIVYNNAFIGLKSAIMWKNTVGMINDDNNASKNWRNFRLEYTYIKQWLFKQLERLSVACHSKIITNSNYLTEYLQSVYPALNGKCYRLYKAIGAPASIKPFDDTLDEKTEINILFVKADLVRGGIYTLLEAASLLNRPIKITVIGPDESHRLPLEERVYPIPNVTIDFKGVCAQKDVFAAMIRADIFCVPSHREALGVANLEAIARGVPVISTNAGGIPEILDEGKNGWLVPVNDGHALAKAIETSITNEALRKKKIQNGLHFSRQFYKEKAMDRFLQILASA